VYTAVEELLEAVFFIWSGSHQSTAAENRRGSERLTPPLVEEETPFPNTKTILERKKFGHESRWALNPE
jgi:hypothetical protein